jgi:hypothetical protein
MYNWNQLPGIPGYQVADYSKGANYYNVSDRNYYHTAENLAIGKGDPCQLVGFVGITGAEAFAYESGWRLPTNAENTAFSGGLANAQASADGKYLLGTIDATGAITQVPEAVTIPDWSLTNTITDKIGLVEFPGGTPAGVRLPAAGRRLYSDGKVDSQGTHGLWLGSMVKGEQSGHNLFFYSNIIYPVNNTHYSYASTIRCVPK